MWKRLFLLSLALSQVYSDTSLCLDGDQADIMRRPSNWMWDEILVNVNSGGLCKFSSTTDAKVEFISDDLELYYF